jgi:hypothetical protein
MRGYRRPGPEYTWTNWWGIVLIHAEEDTDELLRAEDEAIAAALRPAQQPTDLVSLAEMMAERPAWEGEPTDEQEDRSALA